MRDPHGTSDSKPRFDVTERDSDHARDGDCVNCFSR